MTLSNASLVSSYFYKFQCLLPNTVTGKDFVPAFVKTERVFKCSITIQKRGDFGTPKENFDRTWDEYKLGFGDDEKEFWLGNDNIQQLTKFGDKKLRVELEAIDGRTAWAEYEAFR